MKREQDLRAAVATVLEVEQAQVDRIGSEFLRKQAHQVRRLGGVDA